MQLSELITYFNQRFKDEHRFTDELLEYHQGRVEGRFGETRLTAEFQPVRLAGTPSLVVGHDAGLKAVIRPNPGNSAENPTEKVFSGTADGAPVVNLDRFSRTLILLNYLPIAGDGRLFLHVHPRHILSVRSSHGAYFEDILARCGLSPQQVVINLLLTPVYGHQLIRLLDGLRNYRDHGYATAIKFDEHSDHEFLERYCIEFLYRFTPDFVRFDTAFFRQPWDKVAVWRNNPNLGKRITHLVSVLHQLDTQFLLEGCHTKKDTALVKSLSADLVKGDYYDRSEARTDRKAAG
ncbi:MAG: hypothetical protein Kow0060_21220 [Methylohalobius crimeensis]